MHSKLNVLVTALPILPFINNYQSIFTEHGIHVTTPDFEIKESISEDKLSRILVDMDGILCGDDKLTKRVLEQAKHLKVISKWGSGIDSIDSKAAAQLGIKVFRVKDIFSSPVADTVLAYLLLFSRKIVQKDQSIRAGHWYKTKSLSLGEQSLGVIGVGHIGQGVIRRAASFGMTLYGCDVKPISKTFLQQTGLKVVPLEKLLSKSNFISLNCDLNKTTYHIISEATLKLMQPSAYIINTARGALIDESALIRALQEHRIAGAALDVFEQEPLPLDSPLRKLENVCLSPHNSNASPTTFKKVDEVSIHNLLIGLERIKQINTSISKHSEQVVPLMNP